MIKSENGLVTLQGERGHVLADYAIITESMIENFGEEKVNECIRMAKMSDEEVKNEVKKDMGEILDLLLDSIFKQEGDR